jgi:hypothetical protein
MELLILMTLLCLLAIASMSKGMDSRGALDTPEWERRLDRGSFI